MLGKGGQGRCREGGPSRGRENFARYEASMARMDANTTGSAKTQVESELARVQNALAISEEARQKAEDEASCLVVERVFLLLHLGTNKDEVSAIREHAFKEKKTLEEAYEEGFDVIFNYGYGCCAFTYNICGSQPVVPYGMLDMTKPLNLKEKKALEEAYEEGIDLIFNYGYGCCAFTHNICGS